MHILKLQMTKDMTIQIFKNEQAKGDFPNYGFFFLLKYFSRKIVHNLCLPHVIAFYSNIISQLFHCTQIPMACVNWYGCNLISILQNLCAKELK
jgi:hypothetical protein